MTLTAKSVKSLLEDFRSPAPTPGGGSAAALAGAVGASLLAMVAALPKPRAGPEERLREAGRRSAALATMLEALVDRDSEAYELVVGAYRLPKSSEEEKELRTLRIQDALKAAIAAPLEVMRACREGITLAAVLLEHGIPNASSDVRVGLELLRAGLRGAQMNVEINLGGLKDQTYADAVRAELTRLSESDAGGVPSASS
jgi:formiminotetrahydrofolate cyclodeaminase